jgi:hypothetical protein
MSRFKIKNLCPSRAIFVKRAAVIAALFFALGAAQAAPKKEESRTTETYHDLIEKAYNLSLQKDRTQAVGLLVAGIKREGKKGNSAKELLQTLNQVATIFYSDKAQQLYELGISLKFTDPALALTKLQEADRLEPENLSVILELARISIAQNDCDGALGRLKKIKDEVDLLEEAKLVQAQAQICLGQLDEFQKSRAQAEAKKPTMALFWQMADVMYAYKTGSFAKARDEAKALQATDAQIPEAYYWEWKSAQEQKAKADVAAHKYLSGCKGLSPRQMRDYAKEPTLCRHTTEVETFLKKMNNSEI